MLATLLALAALCALDASAQARDVVKLRNGTQIEGRVVYEGATKVVVRVGSREREFAPADVVEVHSVARSLRAALERWERLASDDVPGTLELARFCRAEQLAGEQRLFALATLALDPAQAAAHELAGHEKRGEKWFERDGSKKLAWEQLPELRRDWGRAWTLPTTHYALRTNLELRQALALAMELELFYRTFYDWLGGELVLYEVVEPMSAEVHADAGSYPDADGRRAYFDPLSNVLYVDSSKELALGALIHEATHQLLHNTAVRTRAAKGEIPAWIDEGLAEYTSCSREGDAGRPRYSKGAPAQRHFACHRDAPKPFDLSRVLALGAEDFAASSKAELKYAQAYTLVHFCLHGGGSRQRAGFFEFLRRCYVGKASMTDFKNALDIKEREFEKAWHAYAASGG